MRDIASELACTAPALYRYFPSREALVAGCVAICLGSLEQEAEKVTCGLTSDQRRHDAASVALLRLVRSTPGRLRIIDSLPGERDGMLRRLVQILFPALAGEWAVEAAFLFGSMLWESVRTDIATERVVALSWRSLTPLLRAARAVQRKNKRA